MEHRRMSYATLWKRLDMGWNVERAISQALKSKHGTP